MMRLIFSLAASGAKVKPGERVLSRNKDISSTDMDSMRNEGREMLTDRSFHLSLIRIFPYTAADLLSDLSDPERDTLIGLSPTHFFD
jgi:hypothetical protein